MVPPFVNPCDYGDPEPCGVNPSFVYTRYPCDFDDPRPTDTRGLPVTVDNQTPVKAEVVNRQRESILAIEAELGIQPSGTFTTVRARLDALEGLLCAIWERLQDTGSSINVSLNGTTIVTGVENINFTGTGFTVVDAGGNRADISITGGGDIIEQFICNTDGYIPAHVALPVSVPSQTFFTLPDAPYNDVVLLFIGGIKQDIGDYIISGNQLEWLGTSLITGDIVEVFYTVYGGQGDGYEPIQEALSVDTLGQTVFHLSEEPWDDLVLFFLGGIKQELSNYTVSENTVTWTGSTSLITTDVVEVLYFKRIPGENCGSGSALSVADESSIIETNVEIIDFQGIGVTAVGNGSGTVTVTVQGATTIMHQEVFSATLAQTAFNVTYAPMSEQSTELFIDGVSQTVGTNYTVSGNTVTYSGIPALTGGEEVVVKYFEDLSIVTNPGLPDVLSVNNITDGYDIDFGNNSRGINHLDPVNAQDVATKNYVDAIISSGSGYLGVDVFIETLSDFPTPVGNVITLASNTVYGIDGSIDIGTNILIASAGTKIIGGGGSSTNSEIISNNAMPTLTISAAGVSVDGVTLRNINSGPALGIVSGASDYKVVDTTMITSGASTPTVRVNQAGLGQISDSFIHVTANGSGIEVEYDTTSVLVNNTKFKGVGAGNGVNLDASTGTITITQVVVEGCRFEDLGISVRQNSDAIINGSLAIVNCSGININTFVRTEVGAYTQASVVASNSIWNCVLFNVGLVPGGNQVFRGNIMQGVAQTESPIV